MGKITEKSTKAQIMDAYTQALAELEKLKAMSDSPVSNKLDAAYAQMKDMATATVQAGATVKVVSSDK